MRALVRCPVSTAVDGARPRLAAIDRKDLPRAIPSETSTRSARLSTRRDCRRGAGRMPPCGLRCAKIAPDDRSNTRPISFSPSPRCQRSQTSALSTALNIRRRLFAIASPHPSLVKCCDDLLRPPSKPDIRCLSHYCRMWWMLVLSLLGWLGLLGQALALIGAARTGVISLRAGHFRYRRADRPTAFWMHVSLSVLFMLFALAVAVIFTWMLFTSL